MGKRAVLYARCSGNDAAKTGGANIRAQLDLCREYAIRQGYAIVAELSEDDRGASGAAFNLPELGKALDMAGEGSFDVLIARELDRLSRDLAKQLIVEQELKSSGVSIEYALYDFPDTPEGRLNKNLRAMLAEYEREKIAQRMRRGKRRTVEAGNTMTHGNPPFGYIEVEVNGERGFEIVEAEARVIRLIFEWYTTGSEKGGVMSFKAIAEELTRLGVLSMRDRRGPGVGQSRRTANEAGHWDAARISHIIRNETYAGVWHYGKGGPHPIAVDVPEIVDRSIWKAAQARRASNKPFSARKSKYPFLLDKRLRCGNCGHKLRAMCKNNDERYLYYRCFSRYSSNTGCKQTKYLRAAVIDDLAWGWVVELCTDPGALSEALKAQQDVAERDLAPLRSRLAVIRDLLSENEQATARLLDLYLAGGFPTDILNERKGRLQKEAAALQIEQIRLEEQLRERGVSDDLIETAEDLARRVRNGLTQAEADLDLRRAVMDTLGMTGTVYQDGDEYTLRLTIELLDQSVDIQVIGKHTPKRSQTMPASRASSPRRRMK